MKSIKQCLDKCYTYSCLCPVSAWPYQSTAYTAAVYRLYNCAVKQVSLLRSTNIQTVHLGEGSESIKTCCHETDSGPLEVHLDWLAPDQAPHMDWLAAYQVPHMDKLVPYQVCYGCGHWYL